MEHDEKIPANEVTVQGLDTLVESIFDLQAEIEQIENQITERNKKLGDMKILASKYLEELNRDSYKAPRGTLSRREIMRWSLPATPEDKVKFMDWLREKGVYDQLVTVNSNSMNSFVKGEYDAATDAMAFKPPGLKDPSIFVTLSVRKS